ncbi:MAG: DoxX family protein [Sphingobacteriales bacterium]|nr:DoxX family protein [Sphingobacteriales bacterium]
MNFVTFHVKFFFSYTKYHVMGILHRLESWSTTHHPRWLILLRIALGICLFAKGISFLNNIVSLELLLEETGLKPGASWLPLVLTWLHLLCGFFIIIGLFTRWSALLMMPILAGAVIFVNLSKGLFTAESELGFSILVLLMLLFFFIEGGGPLSLDNYFRKNPK